ncbi:Membrane protein involved in aromatic hydrocarbon degradation [Candidatus Magnetobacterium bavaricum]|uniref:Membrane protein involved in aromatic hydrocarbon degradation n=1 Tax=Candidatus Magnetobacterium bavaricum TaxID=29290 RepID=A0A0F3GVE4_9BACT|nr:Membrane protein involved in aromatic hydrocarbon degradation [Candidatus Magnetobacterium bavaricum]
MVCNADDKPEIGSSPNPVGSGARALGMGGAFIAVADDATAASWNPAGLIQLGTPEVSIVGSAYSRSEDNRFATEHIDSVHQSVSEANLNYLSGVYPIPTAVFGTNMVLSVSYQHLYDFDRKWDFPNFPIGKEKTMLSYRQNGRVSAIGISAAIQVIEKLSLGLTLNAYDNGLTKNSWQEKMEAKEFNWGYKKKYTLNGYNANLGLMWMINEHFTVGAVFKTPFNARITCESSYSFCASNTYKTYERLYMPMSYGVGFAYRPIDSVTVALDIYRTHWEQFTHTDSYGTETSAITGNSVGESNIDPTLQVRLGLEYLLELESYRFTVPFRAGVFYDQAPASNHPDDYYGFSVGTGLAGLAGGKLILDIAYQYRWGSDVGSSLVHESWNYSQNVREHMVYTSLIVHL